MPNFDDEDIDPFHLARRPNEPSDDDAYNYFRHPGDPRIHHGRGPLPDTNKRWGNVVKLVKDPNNNTNRRTTLLFTASFGVPTPIAFQIRFSLDGITWVSANPSATATVTFRNTAAVDIKSAPVDDEFSCNTGEGQPFSQILTTGLNMSAILESENSTDELWVSITAAPVCCFDGAAGPGGGVVPSAPIVTQARAWSAAHEEVFDTTSPGIITPNFAEIVANPNRAALYVCNKSSGSQLLISLAGDAVYPPVSTDDGAFVLPPGGVWEMPQGYTGRITMTLDVGSVGFVTWSEGSYT